MNTYMSIITYDFTVFPVRKAGLKSIYLLFAQFMYNLKNQLMSKVLTKQVQSKIGRYFLQLENYLTKPESRCVREMTVGILNKISTIIKTLLANMKPSAFLPSLQISRSNDQLRLALNYEL